MSILNYNEIKQRRTIIHEDEPWEVIEAQVSRKQANKPVNKTKLKNLITGRVVEHTFHVSDKVHEAEMSKQPTVFQFYQEKKDEYWFSDPDNPKDRFVLDAKTVDSRIKYIPEKTSLKLKIFTDREGEDQIIGIDYPMKITLRVVEAPPSIRGDTATGGRKNVVVETGASINTPLFIETDELIIVKVDTGEYSERAKK